MSRAAVRRSSKAGWTRFSMLPAIRASCHELAARPASPSRLLPWAALRGNSRRLQTKLSLSARRTLVRRCREPGCIGPCAAVLATPGNAPLRPPRLRLLRARP